MIIQGNMNKQRIKNPNNLLVRNNISLTTGGQDRWRTNAVELGIGNFVVGVNTYTNDPLNQYGRDDYDPDGMDMRGNKNKHGYGAWKNGQVFSSSAWIGYKNGNSVTRLGYSHPFVQDMTQNSVHRNGFFHLPFGYQNYYNKYDYFQQGLNSNYGTYNPYNLW